MKYSERLLRYFYHIDHAGSLPLDDEAVSVAELGKLEHGDVFRLYLKCEGSQILIARCKVYGSVVLLALAEFTCSWLEGKTISDALKFESKDLLDAFQLSLIHVHSATLIIRVVQEALKKQGA